MRLTIKSILSLFLLWLALFFLCGSAIAQEDMKGAEEPRYYDQPKTWEQRFTFKGQSRLGPYAQDPNVWVYTEGFAKRFGMPQQWVDPNLKGIEAAAWRIMPTGHRSCGWGGQENACKQEYECYLDVYIDERKHPLPWATDRMVDWNEKFTSLQWLPSQNGERHRPLSAFVGLPPTRYGGITRPPFADPETKREAFYFGTADPSKTALVNMGIYGYERSAYPGLTLLVMRPDRCVQLSKQSPLEWIYRLEVHDVFNISAKVLKRFHEFVVPVDFDRRAIEVLGDHGDRQREFYKQILNLK